MQLIIKWDKFKFAVSEQVVIIVLFINILYV